MVQFYFLAVFFNLVGGFALAIDGMPRKGPQLEGLRTFLRDPVVCLVLGILTCVTGALKLVTVMRGDIPVVGDFLPAVSALAVGVTLLLERYRDPNRRPPESTPPEASRIESFLLDHRSSVGLAGMISGLVHFLFPMVLFL